MSDSIIPATPPVSHSPVTINVTAQAPLKLNSTNYLSWKFQFQTLFVGYDLQGYIDGTTPCPPQNLTTTSATNTITTPNPEHHAWIRQDQLILNALIGSISPTIIPFIAQAATAREAWNILAATYATPSRGRIKQTKANLKNLTKGSLSITEFLYSVKIKADELAVLGAPLDNEDITEKILEELGDDYREFVRAVQARDTSISFDELHEKLLMFEATIQATTKVPHFSPTAHPTVRNFGRNSQFNSGRFSPHNSNPNQQSNWRPHSHLQHRSFSPHNNFSPANPRMTPRPYLGHCQVCGIQGHTAKRCPSFKFVPQNQIAGSTPWSPQANMATTTSPPNTSWLLDSGASHHVTTDLNNLSLHAPYNGVDNIMIGDGKGLPITHTGSTTISTSTISFNLNDVLCVPEIKRNLLSIYKFCVANNVSFEFLPWCFLVKDLLTGAVLAQGEPKDGVYEWLGVSPLLSTPQVFFSNKPTHIDWHGRLGHPAFPVLKSILDKLKFNSGYHSQHTVCNACQLNKSHKQPFLKSTLTSQRPLQLIYSDVWTSPIYSIAGFKYYVIFVDHFSKYTWFYPLKKKSDVKPIFIRFKAIVENFLKLSIVTLYTDNGGEYMALKDFLAVNGISHLTSPPHTPEHNGFAERRHRHIVETGLTLLTHSSIPSHFWCYAFSTAVYLINRMPTLSLNNSCPFTKIFNQVPNYQKLRIFGCLCFPWLRSYTSHKLEQRSKPCIFVGYSLSQSAYFCFDYASSKVFVSRHVTFDESTFPYPALSKPVSQPVSTTPTSWSSPVLFPSVSLPMPSATISEASPDHHDELCTSPLAVDSITAPVQHTQPEHLSASPLTSPATLPNDSPVPSSLPTIQTHVPHPMITRSKNNIHKPIQKLSYHTQLYSPTHLEPSTVSQALKDPNWRQAMQEEYTALVQNNTWSLVPPHTAANVVGCKWIFRLKRNVDGTIARYKARLVAKGFSQRPGLDYHETFSPVIKPTTVRLVLSIAVSRGWKLRQLDINNAFLQGNLNDDVYMVQPPGFVDHTTPGFICKLRKAIYGLKQAPRAWYQELKQFLLTTGFHNSLADISLFIFKQHASLIYLLVYVDDIIVTGNDEAAVNQFISCLATRFSLKDLGPLTYFLGVEVRPHSQGLILSQQRYIMDILHRTNMSAAKASSTPLPPGYQPSLAEGAPLSDPSEYRATVGSLQYLALTRPDICFAVNKLSQFMHQPTDTHWQLVKRLLRYLSGTLHDSLLLHRHSPLSVHAYSDADWGGNKDDLSSTSAYIVYLGRNPISWSSKKQRTIARSSTEAEYRSVADTAAELSWVCSLLSELHCPVNVAPVVYCDNLGATQLCSNPIFHSRMKHIAIDFHFIRERVQSGALRVSHVSSHDQLADALTKPLSRQRLLFMKDKIGLVNTHPS